MFCKYLTKQFSKHVINNKLARVLYKYFLKLQLKIKENDNYFLVMTNI